MALIQLLKRGALTLAAAAALGGGLYALASKRLAPAMPDVALQAGIELLSRPRRVLAFGPHPNDLEFFVGGTLFLLGQNRSALSMAVLSAGEGGRPNAPNLGEIRRKEQVTAANVLGADLYQFALADGAFQKSDRLVECLLDVWRRTRPDVVFAIDPEGLLPRNNPDHAALGHAVIELAREGIDASSRVYLYGTRRPNVLVDITEVIQEKVSALQCHRSQLRGPDGAVKRFVRAASRLSRGRTPAMYTEALYRLV